MCYQFNAISSRKLSVKFLCFCKDTHPMREIPQYFRDTKIANILKSRRPNHWNKQTSKQTNQQRQWFIISPRGNTAQEWSSRFLLVRRKQDTGHVTSVSSKHRIGFGYVFAFLPGVADRSKFSSVAVIHIPLWRNRFLSCAACPCGCLLRWVFLKSKYNLSDALGLLHKTLVCFTFRPCSSKFMPPTRRGKYFPKPFS